MCAVNGRLPWLLMDGLLEEVLAQVRYVKVEGTYKSRVMRDGRT